MLKLNTLNPEATKRLRTNLIRNNSKFKQLGSAFIIVIPLGMIPDDVFVGIWTGYKANIEIETLSDFDKKQELYIH